jgi:hypothetical protein
MSAAPVFDGPVFDSYASISHARGGSKQMACSAAVRPSAHAPAAEVPASLRLTDRGIAVIMVIAGVIMAIALVVIGLTAMRVTSAHYDAGSDTSAQAHD